MSRSVADCGLTADENERLAVLSALVDEHVIPFADEWDAAGAIPISVLDRFAAGGFCAPFAAPPGEQAPLSATAWGVMQEIVAMGSASLQSFLTVHGMVAAAVARWGSASLRASMLPALREGSVRASFAVTEDQAGSDIAAIECVAMPDGDGFVIDGRKRWVSFGLVADIYLIFARAPGGPGAFLVPAEAEGLERRPSQATSGFRAAMLADLTLRNCKVGSGSVVGRIGTGLSHVATVSLTWGRYAVAWSGMGVSRAALEELVAYANTRTQFGERLGERQLVRRLITDATCAFESARALCLQAGRSHDAHDPCALRDTMLAKYTSAKAAIRVTDTARRLHGAAGLCEHSAVQRWFRDAQVLEIIEGSGELLEDLIAVQELRASRRKAT